MPANHVITMAGGVEALLPIGHARIALFEWGDELQWFVPVRFCYRL
jgi:hypothetical protein